METPLVPRSEEQKSKKKRSGNTIYTIICWIFQIALWVGIGYITVYIYFIKTKIDSIDTTYLIGYITIGIYVIYLIL